MRLRTLDIYLHDRLVGQLFQYGEGANAITRLIPEASYWDDPQAPLLSWSAVTEPASRQAFWRHHQTVPFFNGSGASLPNFFQNMLPEGALRRHLAQERNCAPDDHFEIFAACGTDLPGAVYARPAAVHPDATAAIVTQHNDSLEVSVVAQPMEDATSLSGLQAKWSLVAQGGRYVARTRDSRGIHIIAKLPTVQYPLLPEVEELSLRMAAAAGVDVCRATLAALDMIDTDIPFTLGEARTFLAVERFDRRGGREHIHCEDFTQILGVPPDMKYQHPAATYGLMGLVIRDMGLGDEGVGELLRRLAVNELLGNYDAHAKNFGVIYRDARTPALSPAYDIVAYSAYLRGHGHALPFARNSAPRARLTPLTVRDFCNESQMPVPLAQTVVRDVVKRALEQWPDMIGDSALLDQQKQQLLAHLQGAPIAQSMIQRRGRTAA